MKALIIIASILLICSCRTKKINRTVDKKDSVVTNHQDSNYHSFKESEKDSFAVNSYNRQTTIYLKKDSVTGVTINSDGSVSFSGVDSVIVKEKGKSKTKTNSQTKSLDTGHVANDYNTAVHTVNKTVNRDIKPNYNWMYVVVSIVLAIALLAFIIYKLKQKIKL